MITPFEVGVIDQGFAPHEDLSSRAGLSGVVSAIDHGNHVSGIICAKHNGIGIKGALKNCTIVQATATPILTGNSAIEGNSIDRFVGLVSEHIVTVLSFMEANPNVRVINLSLGYNWMPKFNIDPRTPSEVHIRDEVRQQGLFFRSILAYAKARNIAFVLAAGNDSSSLNAPLEAEWASPFNYGAKLMEEKDGWADALIVEAHGADNRRAPFSNISNEVSCPGVDVLSTLASGASNYGKLSGTSMAAPYCAAALAVVLELRPELSLRDALTCIGGKQKSTNV